MDLLRTSPATRQALTDALKTKAAEHLRNCLRQTNLTFSAWTDIARQISEKSTLTPESLDMLVRSKLRPGNEKKNLAELAQFELRHAGSEPKEETLVTFYSKPQVTPAHGRAAGTTSRTERRIVAIAFPKEDRLTFHVRKCVTSSYVTGGIAFKGVETLELEGNDLAAAIAAIRSEIAYFEPDKRDLTLQLVLLESSANGYYEPRRIAALVDELRIIDGQATPDNYDLIEELAGQADKRGLSLQNLAKVIGDLADEPTAAYIFGLLKRAAKRLDMPEASPTR